MNGTLFVVATPIGNLEDMSPRAVATLKSVDRIACEDTRQTAKLISRFSIDRPLISYHEHNEHRQTPRLIDALKEGEDIALVSDAGTPLISDPGFRLVQACREEGIPIVPVPGPSAALAALSVSGLPCHQFLFLGFPPERSGPRKREFQKWAETRSTLVLYLSPHRLSSCLKDLLDVLGDRPAFLIREMTKIHETSYRGALSSILSAARSEPPRGEYTLVIEGAAKPGPSPPGLDLGAYVSGLMQEQGLSRSDAIRKAATDLGMSRREVYQTVTASSSSGDE